MLKSRILFLCSLPLILLVQQLSAKTIEMKDSIEVIRVSDSIISQMNFSEKDSLHPKKDLVKENRKKKIVSAVFAFPFPFGFMGAHRVMLGTSPWVPIVYVATFGGCFGVLPLIDFFVITFSKDIEQYENNPHIFMWVK